jgi:hypothetical protein
MMQFRVDGVKELKRKLSRLQTQLDTTVEIQLNLFLDTLIANMRRRITDETGPNGSLYSKAKDKVFGDSQPYQVTGSLIKNMQNVKLPSASADTKMWSFGVQPIMEDTYSVNLIFEMFRTGKRDLSKDIHKLSTEIAQELESKYPGFKFFYKFIGDDGSKIRPVLIDEVSEIITNVINEIFG